MRQSLHPVTDERLPQDVLQAWSFWRRKDGQRGKYVPPPEQRLKHMEDAWKASDPERALHAGLRA
jgi:hypothetical protein